MSADQAAQAMGSTSGFVLQAYREFTDTGLDRVSLQFAQLPYRNIASGEEMMLKWGFVFFLLAVTSGILGAVDHHFTTAMVEEVVFFGNVVLFVVFTLLGAMSLPVESADSSRPEH